jgi:Cu-processing system ATP-binding protein
MKRVGVQDVTVRFRKLEALSGASVELGGGETVMLVGPNGAGKSTLMKVLLGLVRPSGGSVTADGKPVRMGNAFKSSISYLPEAVAFQENLTGRQVLRFFAWARGVRKSRIDEVLERVGLADASRRAVRGYSRGMRQRLGLAATILPESPLLILDEPTGGLDQEGLSVLWSVLDEWRDKGRMVLLSAHDLALLERRVDRMCVLRSGRVVADDSPDALRRAVQLPHRVRMELAEDANGTADKLMAAMERHGASHVQRQGSRLDAHVAPDALLELVRIPAQYPQTVRGLHVEHPPIDVVYERLLEEKDR